MQKFKNSFLFGAIVLVACNLITKFIGAIYRVPLLKILGSEGLGLYQLVFPVFTVLLVASSSGVNVAMSKFVSTQTRHCNKSNTKKYLQAGFLISFLSSSFFAIAMLFIAPLISSYQGNSAMAICHYALVPSIVVSSLLATLKGYFLGKRKMIYSGGLQVVEQVFKLIFSLILANAFVGQGLVMAVFGTVLGITISEVLALAIAFVLFNSTKKQQKNGVFVQKSNKKVHKTYQQCACVAKRKLISLGYAIKKVFGFGFFVSLQSCIMPLLGAFDSLAVVSLLIRCGLNNTVAYTLYGLEDGIVASLVSMPTVFASSFGQSLVPNIKSKSVEHSTKNIVESFKYVWLIGIASCVVFMFFSGDIVNFLYGGGLSNKIVLEAEIVRDLIKLNSFNIIYLSLLNLSSSILQGLDDSKTPLKNLSLCAVFKIVVTLVLVATKNVNIYGTAIADVVFYSAAFVLNMRAIKRKINLTYSFGKIVARPMLAAVIMVLCMKLLKLAFGGLVSARVSTTIMAFAGIIVYAILLVLTKVVDIKEICKNVFKRTKANQT